MDLGLAVENGDLLMNNWWRSYALLGVVTVALLALSPAKSFYREWRFYQHEYNHLLAQLPVRVPAVDISLKQIWIEDANRIDRCVSCHTGFDEPAATELPQPFTTHPQLYHDPRKFGCTVCHQGQGLATSYMASVGLVKYWDRPILPKRYLEASCGRCHKEPEVPDSPILTEGRQLLNQLGCAGCHEIPDAKVGYVAPLDGIGVRMERMQLYRWLREPSVAKPGTRMPDFMLSAEDASDLTDYLLTFTRLADSSNLPVRSDNLGRAIRDSARVEHGGKLFREARCISCHKVNGKGGRIAEDLGTVGSRLTTSWIANYLGEPKRLLPGVPMPRYGFSEEQRMDLVAYMVAELRDWEFDADNYAVPAPHPGYFERGETLWRVYNCAGCHRLTGAPMDGEKGPSLRAVGVKPTYSLDLGHRNDVSLDLPSYLQTKLAEPRSFFDNLRMPRFELTEGQRTAIVTALLACGGEDELPDRLLVHTKPASTPALHGAINRLFDRYACLTCHTLNGFGGSVAPELGTLGSQLDPGWIKDFLSVPFSRRPILTERMPNLFLSVAEKDTLIQYFQLVYVSDELDQAAGDLKDSSLVERGRSLFYERFACYGCHQVGGHGGYVGPPLDGAGKRLKPGWVRKWLEDPQRWKTNTIEPKTPMNPDERAAIVAFVMSL